MIPAIIERCAGIDVGQKFLAVCGMTGPANEEAQAEVRKFGTVRHELEALRKWLQSVGCTHAVMESTGVYGKPVLNVLEDDPQYTLKIILANPEQVKAVTGHSRAQDLRSPPSTATLPAPGGQSNSTFGQQVAPPPLSPTQMPTSVAEGPRFRG
jgi:hypothetical protein